MSSDAWWWNLNLDLKRATTSSTFSFNEWFFQINDTNERVNCLESMLP